MKGDPSREVAPMTSLTLRIPGHVLNKLDQWRLQQIGAPNRNSCIVWIVEHYLNGGDRGVILEGRLEGKDG